MKDVHFWKVGKKKPEFLERPAAGGHQLMADWWELVLEPNWIGKALHPEQGRELLGVLQGCFQK